MRKCLIILILLLLSGCTRSPHAVDNYESFDELITAREQGAYPQAVAYDLRDGTSCDSGHIRGFMCIFYETTLTLEQVIENVEVLYEKDALILLICEDGQTSKNVATQLSSKGYRHVYYYRLGYQDYATTKPDYVPEIGCDC